MSNPKIFALRRLLELNLEMIGSPRYLRHQPIVNTKEE
jgi:hypothetical protein